MEQIMKQTSLTVSITILIVFFLSGCAHKPTRAALTLSTTPSLENQEMNPSSADKTLPNGEETEQEMFDEEEDFFDEEEEEFVEIADPLYLWNKGMFYFNDKFYFWLLKPAARGYSFIVPEKGRILVSNFFHNIAVPIRFVNNLLQVRIKSAGIELLRFAVNSTVGIVGLNDIAKKELDMKSQDEDLGQTLGTYGIGHGFYIVWPFIGPSSLRDTVGLAGDTFLHPVSYIEPTEAALGIRAYETLNRTSLHIGDYEDLKEAAIDPYIALRDAYIQNRKKKVEE